MPEKSLGTVRNFLIKQPAQGIVRMHLCDPQVFAKFVRPPVLTVKNWLSPQCSTKAKASLIDKDVKFTPGSVRKSQCLIVRDRGFLLSDKYIMILTCPMDK